MTFATPGIWWQSAGLSDVPDDDRWMDPTMAARLGRMQYPKRISETRLARWTAKVAVARILGVELDSESLRRVVIRNAPDGAPEAWYDEEPFDGVIAMTDRADWAVCAVLAGGGRVGCDLELVEPRSNAFVADYLTEAEQKVVAAGDSDLTANLIWSAKESALKVLRAGLRRDTRTVEVDLGDSDATDWQPLSVRDTSGPEFPGWWIRYGEFVLTAVSEIPTPPPVSLEDLPGLATAIPSHAWMGIPRQMPGAPQDM